MLTDAQVWGANAVVNVRFATSSVAGGAAELLAYGTAVVINGAQAYSAAFDCILNFHVDVTMDLSGIGTFIYQPKKTTTSRPRASFSARGDKS